MEKGRRIALRAQRTVIESLGVEALIGGKGCNQEGA